MRSVRIRVRIHLPELNPHLKLMDPFRRHFPFKNDIQLYAALFLWYFALSRVVFYRYNTFSVL